MATASMPLKYWDEAFTTTCFLINRLPSPVLQNKSPFEKLFNLLPDYNFLKVFGCACWPHLRPYNHHKLDFRSKLCVFLGCSLNHKGYRCLRISSGRIYIACNVVFDESQFPFATVSNSSSSSVSSLVLLPFRLQLDSTSSLSSLPSSPLNMEHCSSPTDPLTMQHSVPQPTPSHPMVTRSKNNVHCPKHLPTDFQVLLTESSACAVEPSCFTLASKSPAWREAMNHEL